ncbi:MAG: isocitrate lyase/PEP mutase family protein [Burkholderiaceae bacterium]|jgi:2-methylisocitrate lyase-like PEP mutase family enzyme|nr:isocitrate lyase/PEP mutase family protein [Burkholderiaceae bacterium]
MNLTNQAERMQQMIARSEMLQAPGAPDVLTARLVEHAGFNAIYMTGFGATASLLGAPDIGLMTQSEMLSQARNMVRATNIPVIADADAGYGGISNIERTVHEYAMSGVAAIHLEDQVAPKRCGQMAGIRLMSVGESVKRLKAAIHCRGSHALQIIGRTDALGVDGIDAAIDRAKAYQDAGVDLAFVDGVKTIAQAEQIASRLDGRKVISIVEGNETTALHADVLRDMGFSVVLYAVSTLFATARTSLEVLQNLRQSGSTQADAGRMMAYADFVKIVGIDKYQRLDEAFGGD